MSNSQIEPHLSFPGNAAEAIDFYMDVFEGEKMLVSRFKDLPEGDENMGGDPEHILHATIKIGETPLMISDDPGPNFQTGNQLALTWSTDDKEELHKAWMRFVEAGSKIEMDLEPTFFSRLFGVLVDPYGVQWILMIYDEKDEPWNPP